MTSRSTFRLTVLESASAQKARMISASRCSMVIRRAYWPMRFLVVMSWPLVMITVGWSRPGPVTVSGGVLVHPGPGWLAEVAGPVQGDGLEVCRAQAADVAGQGR